MIIIKKPKALFFKDDHPVLLDLAAKIKEGQAYLHPKEGRTITCLIKSDDIEVHLSKGQSLTDKNIMVIMRRKKKTFFVTLYPEEYDQLMDTIQKFGYKHSEFILASSVSATGKSYDCPKELF